MGAKRDTVASAGDTAKSVGAAVTSARLAGAGPARDMMFLSLKGAAIALRGTSYICGRCADGLEATAAMARGAAGAGSPAMAAPAEEAPSKTTIGNAATVPVDLNTASLAELQRIVFIDEVRAADLISLREAQSFDSLDRLSRVSGIGDKRIEEIKAQGLAVVR